MRNPAAGLLFLTSAALASGCAAGPSPARDAALLSHAPPPAGRDCRIVRTPERLPAADQLVDSVAFSAALRALREDRQISRGYVIFTMLFDRNGWNAIREVVEHDLSPTVSEELQKLVFEHRRNVEPGAAWGARLRIDFGEEVHFQVGRQEICAPRVRGTPDLVAFDNGFDVRRQHAQPHPTPLNTVWVLVEVDPSGAITEARVERAPVPLAWESALIQAVRSLAFEPALLDGVPISSVARVPVRLR